MIKEVDIYVHGSDESMYELGDELGLRDEVLRMFSFAATEFKITLRVDLKTGLAEAVALDGRRIGLKKQELDTKEIQRQIMEEILQEILQICAAYQINEPIEQPTEDGPWLPCGLISKIHAVVTQ